MGHLWDIFWIDHIVVSNSVNDDVVGHYVQKPDYVDLYTHAGPHHSSPSQCLLLPSVPGNIQRAHSDISVSMQLIWELF